MKVDQLVPKKAARKDVQRADLMVPMMAAHWVRCWAAVTGSNLVDQMAWSLAELLEKC